MILLPLLSLATLGITELPPQELQPGRCVTFLWTRTEVPKRIAMVDETNRTLRLARSGAGRGKQLMDIAQSAPGVFAGNGYTVTVSLDFSDRQGLANGSLVDAGSLRVETPGQDGEVVPVGGIRACQ